MHIKTSIAITAIMAVCATATASAQTAPTASRLDQVVQSKELRVCSPGDYKPFSFLTPNKQYEGLDVDMVNSLAASLNAKPVWVATTWRNLMPDMVAGKCDLSVGGISATSERQKTAFFSDTYLVNGKTPLVRCADRNKYQSVKDINKPHVRVIYNPGGTNEKFALANFTQSKQIPHPENITIFNELLNNNADVFVTEAAEARVMQRIHAGKLCAVNPDKPLQFSENAFMLPRGDVVWQQYVNRWLRLSQASGEFKQFLGKWLD